MTITAIEVIRKAKAPMATAITCGVKLSRKVLVRKTTHVENGGYEGRIRYMVDRCPGCGFPVPVVESRGTVEFFIATHTMEHPQHEISCGYEGESLEFLEIPPS
ncbi:MAG: hypothetical protein WC791_00995 [Candidatus Paceibacterota bacterium]|jgi:hypothetical protein